MFPKEVNTVSGLFNQSFTYKEGVLASIQDTVYRDFEFTCVVNLFTLYTRRYIVVSVAISFEEYIFVLF